MIFSSLLESHTPYEQIHISGNHVPKEHKAIISPVDFNAKVKAWVPDNWPCKLWTHVGSPNTFYLNSSHDNSWLLIKFLIKSKIKLLIGLLYSILSFFGWF